MASEARTAAKVIGGTGAAALAISLVTPSGWLVDALWIAARFLGIWCLVSIPATALAVAFLRGRARASQPAIPERGPATFAASQAVVR